MEKLGKYEVLEKIGEGGFGTVYKGRDPYIKRIVAIKTCSSDDEDLRKRFLREAEVVGTLDHPNVTVVHDFGYEGDVPYIVQEYLSGEDLTAVIQRGDPISDGRKLEILVQVARGLAHAHQKGIVHRDVKPNNVRILADGKVKVMDFGIAKLAQLETRLTKTGMSIGTAAYMAPEQLNGEPLDHRCDIFAFGAMAYELITYQRPFNGETMSRIVYQILYEEPAALTETVPWVTPELDRLVHKCMAKDPAQRYASFDEVLVDLETLTGQRRPAKTSTTPVTPRTATQYPPTRVLGVDSPTVALRTSPAVTTAVEPAVPTQAVPPPAKQPASMAAIALGSAAVAVALIAIGAWMFRERGAAVPAAPPPQAPAPVTAPASPPPSVQVQQAPPPETTRPIEPSPPPISSAPRREPARTAAVPPPSPPATRSRPQTPPETTSPRAANPEPGPPQAPPAAPPVQVAPPVQTAPPAPAPAPSAAPASPPPAAAAPARSEEDAVRDVLRAYEAAYENLDARAVRAVWPSLGDQRQRDLQKAFDAYRSLKLDLTGCSITVTGDTARANCQMRQEFQAKVGEGARRESPISFRLRKQGEAWRIESLGG